MTLEIRIAASPGEHRIVVVQDGVLLDYAIDRPGAPDGVGDLHVGRVVAQVPAMAGAFVALDGADGFLPDSAGAHGLHAGHLIAVRVTRAAQGGKGPRLTAQLGDKVAQVTQVTHVTGPVRLISRGPDALTRLAEAFPDARLLVDAPALVASLRHRFSGRVSLAREGFDDALADEVEALGAPTAGLPAGARLHVHPTPALTAIDIDAGGASAVGAGKSAAQAALNRAILPAVARQIRLRNLSGAILVDLAGMPARKRGTLGPAFAEALATDPLRPRFFGFTGLGLAEILRPRIHPPLHEVLAGPHAAGLAALREAALRSAAAPSVALALRAAPAVTSALQGDAAALADLAGRAGRPLILRSDAALPGGAWVLEEVG